MSKSFISFITANTVGGITGSLTQVDDGSPYVVAGNGVSIITQSNGSLLISAESEFPTMILPSSSISVSVDDATDFQLLKNTLTTSSFALITTASATTKQMLSFWLHDTSFPYSLLNSSGTIFTTDFSPVKVNVLFSGADWDLSSYKVLGKPFILSPDNIENLVNWYRSDAVTFDGSNNVTSVTDLKGDADSSSITNVSYISDAVNGFPKLRLGLAGPYSYVTFPITLPQPFSIVMVVQRYASLTEHCFT